MLVWIFQTGEPLHIDKGEPKPMRAMNLANKLARSGHEVMIWSANFYHQERKHRRSIVRNKIVVSERIQIKLIQSSGYQKSIGINRFFDHIELAKNLTFALRQETERPDIAFVGYPPIEFAHSASKWLRSKDIPYVVDVKDQWPHIISDNLPPILNLLSRILLFPYYRAGTTVLQKSTAICSMSESFLKWSQSFGGRAKSIDFVFPLTSFFIKKENFALKDETEFWDHSDINPDKYHVRIIFVGTIGRSFNFEPVLEAAKKAQDMDKRWQFVICGDGDHRVSLEAKCKDLKNIIFPGWINDKHYNQLCAMSHLALAPYKNTDNFKMNIPNKIIDYLRLGMPILSPLNGEVERLVSNFCCGLNYSENEELSLFKKIDIISSNKEKLEKMADNSKIAYLEEFDAEAVYDEAIKRLESLVSLSRDNQATGT